MKLTSAFDRYIVNWWFISKCECRVTTCSLKNRGREKSVDVNYCRVPLVGAST